MANHVACPGKDDIRLSGTRTYARQVSGSYTPPSHVLRSRLQDDQKRHIRDSLGTCTLYQCLL
ncbi:hypothetical protein B0H12DRAFT_1149216, partial [Mycena haematopus]